MEVDGRRSSSNNEAEPIRRPSESGKKKNLNVTGELVSKQIAYINSKPLYFFKFMINNACRDYYGDAGIFKSVSINRTYELDLVYKRHMYISSFKEVKNSSSKVSVLSHLTDEDFEGLSVSVSAKLKLGFKLLDSEDTYKLMFAVNYKTINSDNENIVYVETVTTFKKLCAAFRDFNEKNSKEDMDENQLLRIISENANKMMCLYRIKCSKNSNSSGLRSFMFTDITKIVSSADARVPYINDSYKTTINISRVNKNVYCYRIYSLTAEQNNERIIITFTTVANGDTFNATYFSNSSFNNNNSNNNSSIASSSSNTYGLDNSTAKKLSDKEGRMLRLLTDLNQLSDLIINEFVEAYIYLVVDSNSKYTVTGITKKDIEYNEYSAL
ncbi:LEF-3 [Rachiplusia nu nucleopolyhedrovirus]|uniref:LEF-3 n=1 Tax=Rachiplusia nu nucleopolyhedrovirus TaxID=2605775 RepID=A0AAE6M6J7_9ABAC|nr:LEF-3 [Rachiplusia nu nucleopolyhedrovirus]QEI03667.1 LEF-3 [Rachiplusia nu nucleopolyhedrovirus]